MKKIVETIGTLRIRIPRTVEHIHNYGKISRYFQGLVRHQIFASSCVNPRCLRKKVYLPPRADCPECWEPTEWKLIGPDGIKGKVATFSVVNYPGAGYEEDIERVGSKLPSIIVYVEFPGVDTKLMSRLEGCDPKEVFIGMEVEARFWQNTVPRRKSTYTCLDLYFVPVIASIFAEKQGVF